MADLAKLTLSQQEIETLTKELADILHYMEKLKELDTSQVEGSTHVSFFQHAFREDRIETSLKVEEVLKNAPSQEKDCFKVPKVME